MAGETIILTREDAKVQVEGRTSPAEITLYDGTGLGVQDTAMAKYIYDTALAEGLGHRINFY